MKPEATVAGVRLTHPARVLFPQQGLTKQDLAKFYVGIGNWILPHIVGRPLSIVRCPKGEGSDCFYQKHWTGALPAGVQSVDISEKSKRSQYMVVSELRGLVALVQIGVLEIHPWAAMADALEQPDRLIFDLDPGPGVAWPAMVRAARELRRRLESVGITSFVRTSGGKGLHVVAPLAHRNTWEELKEFARSIADSMEMDDRQRYIATMSKAKRQGKIFIDYFRNQRGATAVASYSTRARASAPVATPLRWDELTARLSPDKYTVENLPRRLSTLREDPWEGFFELRQTIPSHAAQEILRGVPSNHARSSRTQRNRRIAVRA